MIVLSSWLSLSLFPCSVNLVKKLTVYNCSQRFLTFFKFIKSGFCFIYFFKLFLSLPWNCFCQDFRWCISRCQVQKSLSVTLLFLSASFPFSIILSTPFYLLTSLPWNAIFFWDFWLQILLISSVLHLSFLLCCHFWFSYIPLELTGLHFQPCFSPPVVFFYIYLSQNMSSSLMTSLLSILIMYLWLRSIVYRGRICHVYTYVCTYIHTHVRSSRIIYCGDNFSMISLIRYQTSLGPEWISSFCPAFSKLLCQVPQFNKWCHHPAIA